MKTLKIYSMLLATAAVTFLASCGGDPDEDVKPDPAVNFKTQTGYVFASQTVAGDTTVKVGILINHTEKIKNVKFEVTVAGSTFTVKDTTVNNKVIDMDFIRQVISTPGTEAWSITATDADGKTGTASFTLTVAADDPDLVAYESNTSRKLDIYRFQSSEPKSAINLEDMIIYSAGTSVDDGFKDIYDNSAAGTAYNPVWASKSGAMFVKVTGTLDYATTKKYSAIVNYYNSKTPTASTGTLAVDNMYVVKGGDKNRYHLVLVSAIVDGAGVNADYCTIKIKTIDITK